MNVNKCKFFATQFVRMNKQLFLQMKYRLLWLPPLAGLIIFVTVYASSKKNGTVPPETRYEASLRLIGHRLLLSAGDSESRVMPIRQLSKNTYIIQFEKPLALQPDSVFDIVTKTIKYASLPADFTAEVRSCAGNEIMYSFVMSHVDSNTIVPCLGRQLPVDCYTIAITFDGNKTNGANTTVLWMGALVVLLGAWSFFLYRRSRKMTVPGTAVAVPEETVSFGKSILYPGRRMLESGGEKIELTDKEAKLLHILALSPNTTVNRDTLQKEVWENEGVIVTRSLDVFISRLRKKLDKDPGVRLTNVHGKGYKLEIIS